MSTTVLRITGTTMRVCTPRGFRVDDQYFEYPRPSPRHHQQVIKRAVKLVGLHQQCDVSGWLNRWIDG